MRKPALYLLLALLAPTPFTLSTPAQAGDESSIRADFYQNAQTLPRQLLAQGYRRFGDLDLSSVLSRLDQVPVKVVGKVNHLQPNGPFQWDRESAEWNRSDSGAGIALNGPHWLKTNSGAKPMLALHETLGAIAIGDDNFDCSGSLWALANGEARSTLSSSDFSHFQDIANQTCLQARAGGSTGVTGGGDDFNVNFKINAMKKGLQLVRSGQRDEGMDYIQNIFHMNIGLNRHVKSFDSASFMSRVHLERTPIVSTIHVTFHGADVPQDPRNGWTYDAAKNDVVFHGKAIPKPGENQGPAVLCTWAD